MEIDRRIGVGGSGGCGAWVSECVNGDAVDHRQQVWQVVAWLADAALFHNDGNR